MRSSTFIRTLVIAGLATMAHGAQAQDAAPPATGTFPSEQPPATEPAPAQPAPAQPAPAQPPPAQPAPQQQPYPPPQQQAYPPQQQQQPYPPPQQQQPAYPPPQEGYQDPGYGAPPPPPEKPDKGFEMPPWSIRADPFNWLIEGRLGIELEIGILKWLSVEAVPIFVVNEEPPTFNYASREGSLTQESNGLGPIAGSSLSAGFWLEGKALQGYVLRAILTNYGYTYKASDGDGVFDEVSHTERHFYGFIGSHSRWGAFTLAGGIGLGVELNKETRCFPSGATSSSQATRSGCDDDQFDIALDREMDQPPGNLNSGFHPVQIMGRISLGVTID
jgi:hypothetical protein